MICKIKSCDKIVNAKGYCVKHYTRLQRHGDALAPWRQQRESRHGRSKSTEYTIWVLMRRRCQKPSDPAFKHYGGRGIKVCEKWDKSFTAFYADMGARPSKRHWIERMDNDGDYESNNCRWEFIDLQALNKRQKLGSSGHRGVYVCGDRWVAAIKYLGKKRHLGVFSNLEEAILARQKAEHYRDHQLAGRIRHE